jgi:hypothetical protein
MFEYGFNPYNGEADFTETFYGADTGGIDGAFSEDEVLSVLSGIINEAAQKARETFNEGLNEFKANPLVNEILFYTIIFILKVSLYVELKRGLDHGYTNF